MFRRLHPIEQTVTVFIDGEAHEADAYETVAAVLMRQREAWSRKTPLSGDRRAPFCMMGACFECIATVDGAASVQTCLVTVQEGMRVDRQVEPREASL